MPPCGVLARDLPLGGGGRILHLDRVPKPPRGIEGLLHELLDIVLVDPGRAQAHIDLRGVQVFGLCLFQRRHIDGIGGVGGRRHPRHHQLVPDIAGEVIVCGMPAPEGVIRHSLTGVTEDHAL